MDSLIVMPQPRGQITLPKKFRDKYGFVPGMPVRVSDADWGLKIEPLGQNPYVTKPKYSPAEYKKVILRVSEYIRKNGPMWSSKDEKSRLESRKKDEERLKKLGW